MAAGIGGVAGGVLGAIAGGQGNNSTTNTNSTQTSTVNLKNFSDLQQGQSGLESAAYNGQLDAFSQLSNLVNAGPGASAVTDATSAGNQYASLLSQFINNSGLPTSQQTSAAQSYAKSIFAPQQVALQQSFTDQNIAGARAAASMGRSGADPVLLAKLGVEQTRQQQSLNAQQGALASQTAMQLPQQQLSMADALFNVRQNLASQAFNNRSTLLQLGNQLATSERNYRLQTASRTGTSQGVSDTSSGGGLGGIISGLFGGVGSGLKAAGTIQSMGNGNG